MLSSHFRLDLHHTDIIHNWPEWSVPEAQQETFPACPLFSHQITGISIHFHLYSLSHIPVLNSVLFPEMLLRNWANNYFPSRSLSKSFSLGVRSCIYKPLENPLNNCYLFYSKHTQSNLRLLSIFFFIS